MVSKMKKALLPLLISIAMLASCNDKDVAELTQKLQTAEQTTAQLKADLEKSQTELQKVRAEIPALFVTPVVSFEKSEKVTFDPPKDNLQESRIEYLVQTVETNVDWLDKLLYRDLVDGLIGDSGEAFETSEKVKQIRQQENAKQQLIDLLSLRYNDELAMVRNGDVFAIDYKISLDFEGQRQNILSFVKETYTFSGGAHGMYWTNYINIDSSTKSVIKLSTLFTDENMKKAENSLWDQYRFSYGENSGNDTFTVRKDFFVSESFYFTNDGIVFVYPPYALGPYAQGQMTLALNWSELDGLINPDYRWNKQTLSK